VDIVADSFTTAEIRWFQPGPIPPPLRESDLLRGASLLRNAARTDHYLLLDQAETVGIKLREGRLEVKHLLSGPKAAVLLPEVAGWFGLWRKWGFVLPASESDAIAHSPLWLPVKKTRYLWSCDLSRGHIRLIGVDTTRPVTGCHLEITEVWVRTQLWWTLALEAWGTPETDPQQLYRLLNATTTRALSTLSVRDLPSQDSFSYPAWLKSLGISSIGSE
jgi:hypothetical protein